MASAAGILEGVGARYAIIGAVAVGARGYIRTTADVDLLLHVEQIRIPALIQRFDEAGFALRQADVLRQLSGREVARMQLGDVGLDLIPAIVPYFHEILKRATSERIGGATVRVATVEDLLVLKLLAYRAQDKADILGLLAAASGSADLEYVRDRAMAHLPDGDPRLADMLGS